MSILNSISLVLEVITAGLGAWLAVSKGKLYGWLITLTFAIYVVYDLSRFMNKALPFHNLLFLIASTSVCLAVWQVASEK